MSKLTKNSNLSQSGSKGDEFYTPAWLVEKFMEGYELSGKKIYLPFDTEDSQFYKVLKDFNNVRLKEYDDFFDTPTEFLNDLASDGYEIFSNPPFSCQKRIMTKLRESTIMYSLLGFGITWGGLVDGSSDSVHYVGYIKYDNPPEMIDKHEIIRPIRTILIRRDGLSEMRKSPFVYSYNKPYRGKREIDFDNLQKFNCPDINIITIRDKVIKLSDYVYFPKDYGIFVKRDVLEEFFSEQKTLFNI